MKNLSIHTIAMLFAISTYAQGGSAITKGQGQLNLGGFPYVRSDNATHDVVSGVFPYVGLDLAIHDMVTIGFKHAIDIFDIDGNGAFLIGIVSDFHFNKLLRLNDTWDVYAGISSGLRIKTDYIGDSHGFVGGQIGGRWFFSYLWGINVEAGISAAPEYPVTIGSVIGVTMRIW